ncbi:MAG TPA: ATP-binding protein [Ignavibacteriaceae bacterium]|nr:ATP-binding protein [Ignavibacteriaceae bacterium]
MRPSFINRLSIKLILVISSILLINLAIYTFYTLSVLKKDLTEASSQNAYNLSDVIKKSTRYSMLLNRRQDIYEIINTIGTEAGVEKIRIYNKQGKISYSTDSTEINKTVDTNSEACYVCHSRPTLPTNLPQNEMIREFTSDKGKKVIGLINPIKNEADCSNGSCHEHSADKNILGVLDIIVSTTTMNQIIESNTRNIITNAIILTALISAFTGIFISILVNRPLKKISKGMEEISNGNLVYKIDIGSRDELGQVANEFNYMGVRLNTAYNEIKEWSETLNLKVEEKNEELKKIYEQITQIEKLASLGKLSATVAHELNNPLEGILTYSKLITRKLTKQSKDGEFKDIIEFLNLISDESARCGKIVKDLLLFSHKDEGKFSSNEISRIIDKSLILINHHLEINHIKLIKEYKSDNIIAECDSQKVEQALIAVLINAIEAMNEGQTLKVTLEECKGEAVIRITDQGKGIADKDLPYIFEPFFSTKSDNKGTGLGLAVAYGIIKQHYGKLSVESTSVEGTTFKITLPIKKIQEVKNET